MKAPTGDDRSIVIRIEITYEKFSSLFWPTVTGFRCNSYIGSVLRAQNLRCILSQVFSQLKILKTQHVHCTLSGLIFAR